MSDILRSREFPDMITESWAASPTETKEIAEHDLLERQCGNPPPHSCLFGSDFVTVDALGNVSILLVPSFHVMEASRPMHSAISEEDPNYLKTSYQKSRASAETSKMQVATSKDPSELTLSLDISVKRETGLRFGLCSPNWWQNRPVDTAQISMEGNHVDEILQDEADSPSGTDVMEVKGPSVQADEVMEAELSPRLTNYIVSGVVPESPIEGSTVSFTQCTGMDLIIFYP